MPVGVGCRKTKDARKSDLEEHGFWRRLTQAETMKRGEMHITLFQQIDKVYPFLEWKY